VTWQISTTTIFYLTGRSIGAEDEMHSTEMNDRSARRVPRAPRQIRRLVNRRAFQLSAQTYERYRDELAAAIAEGAVSIEDIYDWRPHDRRS
jgi:hypothetical protein